VTKLVRLKHVPGVVTFAAREVTDPILAKINALPGVLEPLKAEDVVVLNGDGINDAPFKDGRRRIRTAAVRQLVAMAAGVPLLIDHPSGLGGGREALPHGRIIEARTRVEDGVTWGNFDFYLLRNVFDGGEYAKAITGGLITENSVGVFFKKQECSIDGGSIWECEHALGATYDGQKAMLEYDAPELFDEWSFVYSGAVKGTRFYKLAAGNTVEAEDADEAAEALVAARAPKEPTFWERCAAARSKRREGVRSWFSGRKPVGAGSGPSGA
jgi:hypothetical protein